MKARDIALVLAGIAAGMILALLLASPTMRLVAAGTLLAVAAILLLRPIKNARDAEGSA